MTLSILLLVNCARTTNRGQVIYLENEWIKAGFLPEVGGRLVFLGFIDGNNILKSDSALWYESPEERPIPTPESGFKALSGSES